MYVNTLQVQIRVEFRVMGLSLNTKTKVVLIRCGELGELCIIRSFYERFLDINLRARSLVTQL